MSRSPQSSYVEACSTGSGRRWLTASATASARLIILSGALLCMLIATNLYLTRTLAKNSTAVATETELSSIIESANGARIAFGEMRYWLTDLAVSLLTCVYRKLYPC